MDLQTLAAGHFVDFEDIWSRLNEAHLDLVSTDRRLEYWQHDPQAKQTYRPEAIQRNIASLEAEQAKRLDRLVVDLYGSDGDLTSGIIPQTMADLQDQAERAQSEFDPGIDEQAYSNAVIRDRAALGRLQNIHQFQTWWEGADRLMRLAVAETLGPEIERKFAGSGDTGLGSLLADFERYSQAQRTSPVVADLQRKASKLATLESRLLHTLERSPWGAGQQGGAFLPETKLQKIRRRVAGYGVGIRPPEPGFHGGVMVNQTSEIVEV